MRRSAEQLERDLDLLEEVTELLFHLRDHEHRVNWEFDLPPVPVLPEERVSWQNRQRRERMDPRINAVADVRARLDDRWPALERMAARYDGAASRMSWSCSGHAVELHGNPIRDMCRWSCRVVARGAWGS